MKIIKNIINWIDLKTRPDWSSTDFEKEMEEIIDKEIETEID